MILGLVVAWMLLAATGCYVDNADSSNSSEQSSQRGVLELSITPTVIPVEPGSGSTEGAADASASGERTTVSPTVAPVDSSAPTTGAEAATIEELPDVTDEGQAEEADEPAVTPTPRPATSSRDTGAVRTPSGILGAAQLLSDGSYAFVTPCYSVIQLDPSQAESVPVPTVLVDPGHGGDEVGSQTPGGIRESDLNLTVSRQVVDLLNSHGISAVLARDDDYRMSIQARTALANSWQPEIVISVHHNGGFTQQSEVAPIEVFHQHFSPAGQRLAGLIFEEMETAFSSRRAEWSATTFTGVQPRFNTRGSDLYGMLRRTTMPTVISEAFYLDGPDGDDLATDADLLDAEADALLRAVQRFLNSDAPGTGFVEGQVITLADPGSGGTSGCVEPPLGIDS